MQGKVGFHALKDVSLYFEKGEVVAIYGPSGCGKTTLLNIIGGLDLPTSGEMVIDSKLTTNFIEKEWDYFRNHKIGFIFQQYNLIEHLPIVENVAISVKLGGTSSKIASEKAIELLTKVGLENHLHKLPGELSGGERQRVAIARALINDPDIILADEPTGALDNKTGTEIMDLIKSVSKDKLVIIVTHNKKVAKKYSTRMIELKDGRVTNDTNPKNEKVKIVNKREKQKGKLSFKEAVKFALYNIKGKKWRTFLVAFGLSVGIVGLILIDAFFNSIRVGLEQQEQIVADNPDLYVMATDEIVGTVDEIKADIEASGYFKEVMYAPSTTFTFTTNITDDSVLSNNLKLEGIGVTDNESLRNTFLDFVGNSRLPENDNEFAISTAQAKQLVSTSVTLTDDEIWEQIGNNVYLMYTQYDYFPELYDLQESIVDGTCVITEAHTEDETNVYAPSDWDEVKLGAYADNILALREYRAGFINMTEDTEIYCTNYDEMVWVINRDEPLGEGVEMTLVGLYENDLFYEAQFTKEFIYGVNYQETRLNEEEETTDWIRYRGFLKNEYIDNKLSITLELEEDGYFVFENFRSGLDFFEGVATLFLYILQFIFSSIIWIAIITGALMLLLILYINVLERKREIGLIRAMGGTRKDVRIIYSGETTIIGFIAGVLSVIISLLLVWGINMYIYSNHLNTVVEYLPFIDPTKVLVIDYIKLGFAILGSIVIALISGLIPSNIAARKKPIDALRND
jgi:putative ABC transport system permease protein